MKVDNLFKNAEAPTSGECFQTLLHQGNVVIERIVSGHDVQAIEYVQDQDEWVLLLAGQAVLNVAGQPVKLTAGDHVYLPARTPHTVTEVSPGTMWLAVHIHPN